MAAFKEKLLELELSGPGSQDRRNVLIWLHETYPITVHIPDKPLDLFPVSARRHGSVYQVEHSFHEEAKRPRMDIETMLPNHLISVLCKAVRPLFAGDDWDLEEMELLRYLLAANCQPANSTSDFARNKGIAREVANFITDVIAVSIRTAAQAAELARILCYVWEVECAKTLDIAARRTYKKFYSFMTVTEKEALLNVGPIRTSVWQRNYGFQTYPMYNIVSADIGNSAISTAEHSTFLRKAFAILRQVYGGRADHTSLRIFKMGITKENGAAFEMISCEIFSVFQPLQFSVLLPHATDMLELLDTAEFPDAFLSVVSALTRQPATIVDAVRTWCNRILYRIREQDTKPQLHNNLLDHGIIYSYMALPHLNIQEYAELAKNDYSEALARRIVECDEGVEMDRTGIQPQLNAARAIRRYSTAKPQPPNTYKLFEDFAEF